jgi:transglutaminase-like putative cysteine protease
MHNMMVPRMSRRRLWLKAFATAGAWCMVAGVRVPQAHAALGSQAVSRRLRFTATFSNPLSRSLDKATFWFYLPRKEGMAQTLRDVQVSAPFRLHSDAIDHTLLELPFENFPPLAQKVVNISVEVLMQEGRAITSGKPDTWNRSERYIESDAPEIVALATELKRPSDADTAYAIYEWVSTHINYAGYLADDYGALYALERRRGDCTEYAYLATALARASGLPARVVGGYVVSQDALPRAEDYHNWAEVYFDGKWRLLDAQKQSWLKPAENYVAFRYYQAVAGNPLGSAHRFHMDGELAVRL